MNTSSNNKPIFKINKSLYQIALLTTLTSLTISAYAEQTHLTNPNYILEHQNTASSSQSTLLDSLIKQSRQEGLATHPTWLRMHYYDTGNKGGAHVNQNYHSKIENSKFFISAEGRDNPQAELEGFMRAVSQGDDNSRQIICQFPARTHWLKSKLNLSDNVWQADCPNFEAWMHKLDPQRLSVVFAEEYPDRPVSAFGHTVMLIDSTDSLNNPSAINEAYALNDTVAGDPDDSIVVYAFKSLFGAYPNDITIDTYPEKLADYVQVDNRDVWTYPIDLTHAEVQQVMRHVWETKDLALPYYLTKDNCASEILRYIDVVRPEGSLLDEFKFAVVPASVVRLLDEKGLLNEAHYIPADKTLTQAKLNNPQRSTGLPKSALSETNTLQLTKIVPDSNNPINAHDLQQGMVGIGRQGDSNYLTLDYRYGFNDHLNRPDGYPQNFDMQVLGASLRIYDDNDSDNSSHNDVKIQDITLIKGRSFNPINTAYSGQTWGVDLGAHRIQDGSVDGENPNNEFLDQSHLVANLGYERGVSMAFGTPKAGTGALPPHLCYALGGGTVQGGRGISNGYRVGVGANLGCRYIIGDKARITGEIQLPYWYHGDIDVKNTKDGYLQPILSIGAQYDIDKNQALRLRGSYQFQDRIEDKEDIQLAYVRHF